MTQTSNGAKSHLKIIKGGAPDTANFPGLPFDEKLAMIRALPAKKRLALLGKDKEGKHLVRALPSLELYWMILETGPANALELVEFSSPEQCALMLELELWRHWSLDQEKAIEWLEYLIETGEARLMKQLSQLDFDLLLLVVMREISVDGGLGDLSSNDERTTPWDHSFDNLYFISYLNPKHARLIGTFLDIIFRNNELLYLNLMEGVKEEAALEIEELAYASRSGRLADEGFPDREEAVSIYARLDPSTFIAREDKKLVPMDRETIMPVISAGTSLLTRALELCNSPELTMELNYLINSALVVEESAFADRASMETVFRRVYGNLSIALEYLCGNDTDRAALILKGESLKRLFSLGHNLIRGLRKTAQGCSDTGYATGKALAGLTANYPRFYRGLDPDGIDDYREFRNLGDVNKMKEFLAGLTGD